MAALDRTQGRPADAGAMFDALAERALLASPAAREIVARLDAATSKFVGGIDRQQHVEQIALVVLRAKGGA